MSVILFLDTLNHYIEFARTALFLPPQPIAQRRLRHYMAAIGVLVLLPLYLLYQWLGLILDELLFPDYRNVPVSQPLFVLGVPRSGTTALHTALADDPQLTTFRTWECLFALSITYRRLWRGMGAVDRRLGQPVSRIVQRLQRRAFAGLRNVHPMSLTTPEEDYFTLVPVLACFLLVIPFPDAPSLWRLGRGDAAMPTGECDRLMHWYRRCAQRHLYVHGPEKRFLAKNPSYSPLAAALIRAFPDARILCCLRDPAHAVSSQLSTLRPSMKWFHGDYDETAFNERIICQLGYYYRHLLETLQPLPPHRALVLPSPALRYKLEESVIHCYRHLHIGFSDTFANRLRARAVGARTQSRNHRHQPEDFGLSPNALAARFKTIYERVDFTRQTPITFGTPCSHASQRKTAES